MPTGAQPESAGTPQVMTQPAAAPQSAGTPPATATPAAAPRVAAPAPPARPTQVTSPLRSRGARVSFLLLGVFSAIYFLVAIITSAAFQELAAFRVLGLPLGFLLGLVVVGAGLVVTRIQLTRGEG